MTWTPNDVAPITMAQEFAPPADPSTVSYWGPWVMQFEGGGGGTPAVTPLRMMTGLGR